MEFNGEYRIPAPRQRVWEALNDPETLKRAIPGCQELEKVTDDHLTAKVQAKVGPVKATFGGDVRLLDLNPPESYRLEGSGKGGAAGFAKGGARVQLAEDGPDATVLTYNAQADVGGKLAQLGSRLIQGTAKKYADDFFGSLAKQVGGEASGETVPAPAAAPAAASAPAGAGVEQSASAPAFSASAEPKEAPSSRSPDATTGAPDPAASTGRPSPASHPAPAAHASTDAPRSAPAASAGGTNRLYIGIGVAVVVVIVAFAVFG